MLVNHRRADHSVATEQDRNLFLVHIGRDLAKITLHDLADTALPWRAQELAEADLANRTSRRIDNEDEIETRVAELRALQEVDGLTDRPE